ncbi:MAG: hypothetical protein LC793_17965 [Thermomicrobia bacterium]|nr:hypothetical protein [Thermomicrobia bacterium]
MTEDQQAKWERLQAEGVALTFEFDAITRNQEAGLLPYADALARRKAISVKMRAIADEMRALVPDRSNPAPPISN